MVCCTTVMVAALELADGQHHVQFAHAQADEGGGFLAERGDQRTRREEKPMTAPTGYAGAGKCADCRGSPHGIYHDAGEAVADGLGAERLNLLARGFRLQQSVVDDGRQRLPTGESLRGKCGRVKGAVVKIQIGILDGVLAVMRTCSLHTQDYAVKAKPIRRSPGNEYTWPAGAETKCIDGKVVCGGCLKSDACRNERCMPEWNYSGFSAGIRQMSGRLR